MHRFFRMPATESIVLPSSKPKPFRILVCDDQVDVLEAMRLLLKGQGWQSVTVESPRDLLRASRAEPFDLILADLNYTRDTTSGEEGLDLLASLDAQGNAAPVIVMTAWGNVDLAVEAMRRGACDFIQKPWDNDRVVASIRKQADSERRRKSELEIAANVQQKLFPRNLRAMETLDYAAQCVAAREVGGDYYDFLEVADRAVGFVLADVSGKGVPAALADGESTGLLPQPTARRAAASRGCSGHRESPVFRIDLFRTLRDAFLRRLQRPDAPPPLCELRPQRAVAAALYRRSGTSGPHRHHVGRLRKLDVYRSRNRPALRR